MWYFRKVGIRKKKSPQKKNLRKKKIGKRNVARIEKLMDTQNFRGNLVEKRTRRKKKFTRNIEA